MNTETESSLCKKIDNLAARVDALADAIGGQAQTLATLAEKINHPCERVLRAENRLTKIEAMKVGKGELIARWCLIAAVIISALGLLVSWLK